MIIAYKKENLEKLELFETAKDLKKGGFIAETLSLQELEENAVLYHPGWLMRILLFIAGYLGLSGILGLVALLTQNILEDGWKALLIITGFLGLMAFEFLLIGAMKHFKSGLTEVVLYHAVGFLAAGLAALFFDFEALAALVFCVVCFLAALRYLDKTLTLVSILAFATFIFLLFADFGGMAQKIIPFVFIIVFGILYFVSSQLEKRKPFAIWMDQIYVLQALSLIFVYAGANYFVVRELGQSMLGLQIEPGQDIAFAWFFYAATALLPLLFLAHGLKYRNRISLWVGLLATGFSVFTFKFYFSLGHPEITITISGAIVLAVAIFFLNKLKNPINGFTRDQLGVTNTDGLTAEGIFISQTVSGVRVGAQQNDLFGGGQFGGGGASGNF